MHLLVYNSLYTIFQELGVEQRSKEIGFETSPYFRTLLSVTSKPISMMILMAVVCTANPDLGLGLYSVPRTQLLKNNTNKFTKTDEPLAFMFEI